jgi:hypothetical protein
MLFIKRTPLKFQALLLRLAHLWQLLLCFLRPHTKLSLRATPTISTGYSPTKRA